MLYISLSRTDTYPGPRLSRNDVVRLREVQVWCANAEAALAAPPMSLQCSCLTRGLEAAGGVDAPFVHPSLFHLGNRVTQQLQLISRLIHAPGHVTVAPVPRYYLRYSLDCLQLTFSSRQKY